MGTQGNTTITPRLGAIVRYTLTEQDVHAIAQARRLAGSAARQGNDLREGDTYPAMIVRDWIDRNFLAKVNTGQVRQGFGAAVIEPVGYIDGTSVNLQVFLDGNDTYWATSRTKFDPATHGRMDPEAPEFIVEAPADEMSEDEKHLLGKARSAHHAKWFRPDPRGHWTQEPVAW